MTQMTHLLHSLGKTEYAARYDTVAKKLVSDKFHWELSGQFQYYFESLLFERMNSLLIATHLRLL